MKILITGANSGMGLECAKSLAQKGHELLLTVRSEEKSRELQKTFPDPSRIKGIYVVELDSFTSIYRGASKIFAEHPVIDVLVLNAGIMAPPYRQTVDGYESQFQSNYLGHFYLFQLLQERLLASPVKKVISISSLSSEKAQARSVSDFEAVARVASGAYNAMTSYRESKLAQILFTRELDARFGALGLRSFAVHPGVVNTNLFYRKGTLYKILMQPLAWLGYLTGLIVTPKRGAKTALHLVLAESGPGGHYWAKGRLRQANPIAEDSAFCRDFYDWSLNQLPAVPFL